METILFYTETGALGNFILSKLISTVYESLSSENIENIYCCTDSQISLARIRATNQEFNKVNAIRNLAEFMELLPNKRKSIITITRSSKIL